jgi:hypothetical protein
MKEIEFDPTSSDARRERTEHAVLARLAAIQAAGKTDLVLAPPPSRRRWIAYGVAAAALAAAIGFVIVPRGEPARHVAAESPSLIVTPVGGSSRFTVDDSVIDAGGDTSVEVKRGTAGETTLVLARGSVDCNVEPRAGRPPFRVDAGDVLVEVVGTRFTVARHGEVVRVDVTRGKVRVTSGSEQRVLAPGDSWTPGVSASTPPPPTPPATDEAEIEIDPAPSAKQPAAPSPENVYKSALQAKDPALAARAYRTAANGKSKWAALALYGLAELHADSDRVAALRDLDELARRFPHHENAEDAAHLRFVVLSKMGRTADARAAAAAYLRDYPQGTYAKSAARLASP